MRIDAHQHFWRIARGDYAWLSAEAFPHLHRDFLPSDLAPLLERGRIDRTVLIQAAESVAETEFLLEIAAVTPFVAGVVGWVDLASPQAAADIERLASNPALKGLRPMLQDLPEDEWILRSDVEAGIGALQATGLRFDALIKPPQLRAIRRLLDRHPDLEVVIDHGAKPQIAAGLIDDWADEMRAIARDSRAQCKLSGLATEAGPGWSAETIRPYVEVLFEAFGQGRLMFGSDWPVLTGNGDYPGWLRTVEALAAGWTRSDQDRLFGGTAAAFYGIEA